MAEFGHLYECRLAARALALVLEQFNLRDVTRKFDADDPSQVFAGMLENEVGFYDDFRSGAARPLAVVVLHGSRARVWVERVEDLVRSNHRKGFQVGELGIVRRANLPDLDVEVDLTEVMETDGELMRTAKRRPSSPASKPFTPTTVLGFRVPR